jgi:hypothetical protein
MQKKRCVANPGFAITGQQFDRNMTMSLDILFLLPGLESRDESMPLHIILLCL